MIACITSSVNQLDIRYIVKLFSAISRYASISVESGKDLESFEKFKEIVTRRVAKEVEKLEFEDMLILSMPLAAEKINNENIWKRFRDLIFENQ